MEFSWNVVLENALYFLALLNPASKVMFLASYEPKLEKDQVFELAWKSSIAAFCILVLLGWCGELLLSRVFRVELYSLKITGGLILFFIGFIAVREGRFANKEAHQMRADFTDLSLVPLAAPLIAGPGTIAAGISITAEYGILSVMISMLMALFVNFGVMLFSVGINRLLEKTHLLGPLIRLTGLIISAVAVQMIITGCKESGIF